MTTLEDTRKNAVEAGGRLRQAMPSRAKYYFNSDGMAKAEPLKNYNAPRYTGEEKSAADSVKAVDGLFIEDDNIRKDVLNGNPNLLPTGQTLSMLKDNPKAPAKPFDSDEKVSYRVNTKGKMLFAVYAVLVLSLILVIVMNALAIERQKSENASLNGQVMFAAAQLEELSEQAESLSGSTYIIQQAQNYGMVQKEAKGISLDLPEISQKTGYAPQTNWFDWFCDLLC